MLKTQLCDVLGIDVPIIPAPMGLPPRPSLRPPCPTRAGRRHRVAQPLDRRDCSRHRRRQGPHQPPLRGQPPPAGLGSGVSPHARGASRGDLLRPRRPGEFGSARCRGGGNGTGHGRRPGRRGRRARCRRDHRAGRRGRRLRRRGHHGDPGAVGTRFLALRKHPSRPSGKRRSSQLSPRTRPSSMF